MDLSILDRDVQAFIAANTGADLSQLALRKNPFPHSDYREILNQIAARTKAKVKQPSWYSSKNIIYPSKISVEQTSSEITANYKSQLVIGESLIDLTGGFGVDDYYFAKRFQNVTHCEIDPELSAIVRHNFDVMNVNNIQCVTGDSIQILKSADRKYDVIYIDPSRRSDVKGKVFLLKDCIPNVPALLDDYFNYSDTIVIKTAPILDISAALEELRYVKAVHIVGIENEVKELLFIIQNNFTEAIEISAVNIVKAQTSVFKFRWKNLCEPAIVALPKRYLYEPNSSIMKSGGFDELAFQYQLPKLHKHSHLYTSDELIADFPGRIFEVQQNLAYTKSNMKQVLENTKANITTRNFPESVESIRSKWKIKDGGSQYCFFTTDLNDNKIVLICNKI